MDYTDDKLSIILCIQSGVNGWNNPIIHILNACINVHILWYAETHTLGI